MDDKKLQRANFLKEELRKLDSFIFTAEKVWTGKLIKKELYKYDSKLTFISNAYGYIEEKEFEMNTTIKNKVLDVLRQYLKELEEEFESI